MDVVSMIITGGIGIAVLFILFISIMLVKYYTKAPADRAYVRTGGKEPKVVVDGASFVIPALHTMTWVDLRTMDIDVERTGTNALLTTDPQYADIRAIFYIKVDPTMDGISKAARTIGGAEVNAESVKRMVESKLEGALRDVAATFTLMSLHKDREQFVQRVQELVRQDLAENGLVLESVSITALKSARQGTFNTDDVFGAQVARANAEIIQEARRAQNAIDQAAETEVTKRNAQAEQERNNIARNTELEIARRNAEADTERLALERQLAQARATQEREIAIRQAEEVQAAELARVSKERAIAEAEQAKEQAVQLAEQAKEQAVQLAVQERGREVERSKVAAAQSVQVAEQERLVALAQQQALLEAAEQARLEAAAKRQAAEQQVLTVEAQAAAEREAQIQVINAERDAKRERINRQNEVEIEALKHVREAEAEAEALNKKAEAEATAAIKMAEARRTEAQAQSDSDKLSAEAQRAMAASVGLAEAEVIEAKARAAQLEADAIRARGLAEAEGQRAMADALAANDAVAQQLEIERIRVQAQIQIGIAQAQAMGQAMAAMDFKLYGSPETAQQLLRMVGMADGIGGLLQDVPAPLRELGGRIVDRMLPANGHGNGHGNGGEPAGPGAEQAKQPSSMTLDLAAALPHIAAGVGILREQLTEEELGQMTLGAALEAAIGRVKTAERPALFKLQGMLALVPQMAGEPVQQAISLAQSTVPGS